MRNQFKAYDGTDQRGDKEKPPEGSGFFEKNNAQYYGACCANARHTAYAVPIGNTLVTLYNRYMLMARQTKNPAIQPTCWLPVAVLALPRQMAKPVSNKPAMMSSIQFI